MRTNLKRLMSLVAMVLFTTALLAQSTFKGRVVDVETGESIPGANVTQQGTTNGASTDIDGNFTLQLSGKGKLTVSFIGYADKVVAFNAADGLNLGKIALNSDTQMLGEVVVMGSGLIDVVKDRQTPIAVSTISSIILQEKSGNQEFPELMKNTPSVQVAQGGGYGDARINIRGFKQDNTAYLLNGQPINGMEKGKLYWSNWSGMNDIANAVQIQRGLGSSKLAISSVGGTVNIITKATEKKKGGLFRTTIGNDAFMKYTLAYNTGVMKNKLGVSLLLTHWQGDGYMNHTKGAGQNYFLSLGWKPNDKHLINFLITGAPQWHDRSSNNSISDYLKYGKKYNGNGGYLNGEYVSMKSNYYHKPVINLNWDWNISEESSLSTVLYASFGGGGGISSEGRTTYTENGLLDLNKAYSDNLAINGLGGYKKGYMKNASVNSHRWFGAVTNFKHKLSENWTINLGADARHYVGYHFKQFNDFMGLKGYKDTNPNRDKYPIKKNMPSLKPNVITESYSNNSWKSLTNYASESERYSYDNDDIISYGGVFGQVEYNTEYLSAFFQGAISRQIHNRTDRYAYKEEYEDAPEVTNNGFNLKGGLNYKINDNHNIFVNTGYYSRQPYHNNIYLNHQNIVNPFAKNEKILGFELGYQFKSLFFDANLNLYRTSWKDRVISKSRYDKKTQKTTFINNSGVSQLHQGVEMDFRIRPASILTFNGFVSYGNWEYDDNAIQKRYNEDQTLIDEKVTEIKGGKVGDSPQFQMGLGFVLRPINKLKFDMDWKYNDKLYADVVRKDNIELPSYNLFDAGFSYEEAISDDMSIKVRFNVNNLLNTTYISEMVGDRKGNVFERTSQSETYKGIDVRNLVRFGYGRTFNVSATLKF